MSVYSEEYGDVLSLALVTHPGTVQHDDEELRDRGKSLSAV